MKNERETLKEKLEKNYTIANFEEIVQYCKNNINTMDMKDDTDAFLCHAATNYLMRYKIGKFDKSEAEFLTQYCAEWVIKIYENNGQLSQQVDIEILEQEQYDNRTKSDGSRAICMDEGDGKQKVIYSEKVVKNIMSSNPGEVLFGLQTIGHEVTHAAQNSTIRTEEFDMENIHDVITGYIMALETMTKKIDPQFYEKNYKYLIKENYADAQGLILGMAFLKSYSPNFYKQFNQQKIQGIISEYQRNAAESERTFDNVTVGKESIYMLMELATRKALEKKPEYLQEYPILKVAYREDGTRKDITELLADREQRITKDQTVMEGANTLLLTVLKSRDASGKQILKEMDELEEYIYDRQIEDGFEYEVLKNRLLKGGTTEQEADEYIKQVKDQHRIRRQTEEKEKISPQEEQKVSDEAGIVMDITQKQSSKSAVEKHPEREESFRDEVGDDNDKNVVEQQLEQSQVSQESKWMETMKGFSDRVTEIEGYSKKQGEIVRSVFEVEKQKEEERTGITNSDGTEK